MRTICVVTGSRAEYGLLSRLMRMIKESQDCRLQVIATNMHLLPEYGNTYLEIERDGFHIDAKVSNEKNIRRCLWSNCFYVRRDERYERGTSSA